MCSNKKIAMKAKRWNVKRQDPGRQRQTIIVASRITGNSLECAHSWLVYLVDAHSGFFEDEVLLESVIAHMVGFAPIASSLFIFYTFAFIS